MADTPVLAHIKDEVWLEQFRAGKEVIVPGSALVCDVAYSSGQKRASCRTPNTTSSEC